MVSPISQSRDSAGGTLSKAYKLYCPIQAGTTKDRRQKLIKTDQVYEFKISAKKKRLIVGRKKWI